MLIGQNSVGISPSRYFCMLFTEPGPCTNVRAFLSTHKERRAREEHFALFHNKCAGLLWRTEGAFLPRAEPTSINFSGVLNYSRCHRGYEHT